MPPEEERNGPQKDEVPVPFICVRPLQDELASAAQNTNSGSSYLMVPNAKAASFAQVAAMSRTDTEYNLRASDEATTRLSPSNPLSLVQLGTIRRKLKLQKSKKKPRKWTPLDLEGIAPAEKQDPGILSPPESTTATASHESVETEEVPTTPRPGIEDQSFSRDIDPDPTPTQELFSAALRLPHSGERSLIHQEDSDSTKHKLQDIMARIDDAFDVEDWDSGQGIATSDYSPEPIAVKAQSLAYTTVGSLVKTNATPQFTAPVRIQREGASRRPPPTPITTSGHDSSFSVRGTTPQFGMGYGSPLTAHHGPFYNPQRNKTQPSYSIADDDKDAILRSLGVSTPTMRSGNVPQSPRNYPHSEMLRSAPPINNPTAPAFYPQGLIKDAGMNQAAPMHSSLSLDKMQTLQRLSQFPNPMQQVAKDRLSNFAAAKMQSTTTATGPPAAPITAMSHQICTDGRKGGDTEVEQCYDDQERDYLDYHFNFPPPGLPIPSKPNASTTGYTQQSDFIVNFIDESNGRQPFNNPLMQVQSGYLKPLTAGPPGLRQATAKSATGSQQYVSKANQQCLGGQYGPGFPLKSPWGAHHRQNMFSSVPVEGSLVRDTLSRAEASKYFPNGFPLDYTGHFEPLPATEQRRDFGVISRPAITEEKAYCKKQDGWWYSGTGRIQKTVGDHLYDLEKRENEQKFDYAPQRPPSPLNVPTKKPLTVEQINDMSSQECAAPLLHGLFGTILGYADQVAAPNNLSTLSGFTPSPSWRIDDSVEGYSSFFTEDGQQAPRRDPRYQLFQR